MHGGPVAFVSCSDAWTAAVLILGFAADEDGLSYSRQSSMFVHAVITDGTAAHRSSCAADLRFKGV